MENIENLTLTQSMLDSMPNHLKPKRSGKYIRTGCPFHESTTQRSLSINTETQSFKCFSCGAWGYTDQGRANYKPDNQPRSEIKRRRITASKPVTLDLADLKNYQANLEQGRAYLSSRRIPFELAKQLGAGVGMLGGAMRLILPHSNLEGEVVSLYGRRIDGGEDFKHYHLSRPKGVFNAQAMTGHDVWITEGAFDCLALIASGITNAVAVFGLNGIRWDWLKHARRVVLCFDQDNSGIKAVKEQAEQAQLRGVEVLAITAEELGGANDIAEAWQQRTLDIKPLPSIAMTTKSHSVNIASKIPKNPPTPYTAIDWIQYRDAARQINQDHLSQLFNAGWSELEIFGIPPASRAGGGIAWSLCDAEITQITSDSLTVKRPSGAMLNYYRYPNSTARLKLPY